MKKILLASAAAVLIAGAAFAQMGPLDRGPGPRGDTARPPSPQDQLTKDDRIAIEDGRIAAIRTGLKLTPEQEKLWPPIEAAARDLAKARIEHRPTPPKAAEGQTEPPKIDQVARMRERAEAMSSEGAALKRFADAVEPLYKSLDDGQKRRLGALSHGGGPFAAGPGRPGGEGRDDRSRHPGFGGSGDQGHAGSGGPDGQRGPDGRGPGFGPPR